MYNFIVLFPSEHKGPCILAITLHYNLMNFLFGILLVLKYIFLTKIVSKKQLPVYHRYSIFFPIWFNSTLSEMQAFALCKKNYIYITQYDLNEDFCFWTFELVYILSIYFSYLFYDHSFFLINMMLISTWWL